MKVLAVDPGGRTSGLVVRSGRTLLDHQLVHRGDSLPTYLTAVVQAVDALDFEHAPQVIAVEDVVPPNPHVNRRKGAKDGEELNLTDVQGLLDTSFVIGALLMTYPDAELVRPNRHGRPPAEWENLPAGPARTRTLTTWLRSSYPPELIAPRETTGTGKAPIQHCRAAWDVGAAVLSVQQRFGITS